MLWWFSLFCVNTDFYNRIRKRFSMPWYMYISCSLLQPKHCDICVNIEFMINTVKNYCLLNESLPLNFAGQLILHFQIYSECCLSLILEESLRKMKKNKIKNYLYFSNIIFSKPVYLNTGTCDCWQPVIHMWMLHIQ